MSVYLDDLICSCDDVALLTQLYESFLVAFAAANLAPNPRKLVPPSDNITVFNCDLRQGFARVTEARIAKYFSEQRSAASIQSFEAYCTKESEANAQP